MKKPYGLIVLIILVCGLFGGLAVRPVGAIIFTEQQITSNNAAQENPAIYEYGDRNYTIVWQDNRNGNWDIYMWNPWQPGEIRITNNSGNQINPKIYGDTIVYQDDRNGNWDIYMYNLTSKVETQITNNTADQEYPAIDGNRVVWQDDGDGNIYMYGLTTQIQQRVTTSGLSERCHYPAISGNRTVYEKDKTYTGGPFGDRYTDYYICCFDLSTGQETTIAGPGYYDAFGATIDMLSTPAIYGNQVTWASHDKNEYASNAYNWNVNLGIVGGSAYWSTKSSLANQESPDIYGNYLVYQDDRNGVNGGYEIYLYSIAAQAEYRVTTNYYAQMHPAISCHYGNYIVYQDNRNGNWDIYLNAFGYGVGSVGGGLSPTPSPSNGTAINWGNHGLLTIIISAAAIVVVAIVGAVAFIAMKRQNSKKSINKSTSK
jgi:beta propeller repeat protein